MELQRQANISIQIGFEESCNVELKQYWDIFLAVGNIKLDRNSVLDNTVCNESLLLT